MNNIIPFTFENQTLRTVMREGEPWFVAKDVALALGYANTREAIIEHCKGGSETLLPSVGGTQTTKVIPESDVYRLIFRSKKEEAVRFADWVFDDVLPTLRKTGTYSLDRWHSLAEVLDFTFDLYNQLRRRSAGFLMPAHKVDIPRLVLGGCAELQFHQKNPQMRDAVRYGCDLLFVRQDRVIDVLFLAWEDIRGMPSEGYSALQAWLQGRPAYSARAAHLAVINAHHDQLQAD